MVKRKVFLAFLACSLVLSPLALSQTPSVEWFEANYQAEKERERKYSVGQLREDIDELRNDMDAIEIEIDELRDEVHTLIDEVEVLKDEVEVLKNETTY